ncbi:MAG: DUF6978 family protein [Candidatus Thorarchaeota archaeon]
MVDIGRRRRSIARCRYQETYARSIVLVQLDWTSAAHRNPTVESPPPLFARHNGWLFPTGESHLYVYVENYDDRWALRAHETGFIRGMSLCQLAQRFFEYCNIEVPSFQGAVL